jgi:hypothetical protein
VGLEVPEDRAEAKAGDGLLDYILKKAATQKPSEPSSDKQEEKRRKLTADYQSKRNEVAQRWKRIGEESVEVHVKPRKADVRVTHFGLAWAPFWSAVRR